MNIDSDTDNQSINSAYTAKPIRKKIAINKSDLKCLKYIVLLGLTLFVEVWLISEYSEFDSLSVLSESIIEFFFIDINKIF